MFAYFKMKRKQWKIKNAVYDGILEFMENKKDIVNTAKKLFEAVKDVPAEDIRDEFIGKLAEIIHAESRKKKNGKAIETGSEE